MGRIQRISVFLVVSLAVSSANAGFVRFAAITNNHPDNASIGEAQLFAEMADPGGNQVLFTFFNSGPSAATVSEVYFDDGTLLGLAVIDNSGGVSFARNARPANLPAANNVDPPFHSTAGFSAEALPAAPQNGINPDDFLGILFDLQVGMTYDNVITDLQTGNLRIGLHVVDFDVGTSESLVNIPPLVPEPTTDLLLFSLMMSAVFALGWQRIKLKVFRNE